MPQKGYLLSESDRRAVRQQIATTKAGGGPGGRPVPRRRRPMPGGGGGSNVYAVAVENYRNGDHGLGIVRYGHCRCRKVVNDPPPADSPDGLIETGTWAEGEVVWLRNISDASLDIPQGYVRLGWAIGDALIHVLCSNVTEE